MILVGIAVLVLVAVAAILRMGLPRVRASVTVIAFGLALPALALAAPNVNATAVVTVPLATAAGYSVLGGSTVTNTGNTVLASSLGLSPGSSVTGFPPGKITPPATLDIGSAAIQAKQDLTTAYNDAAGRLITATTAADLAGLNLSPGVYSGPNKSALALTGTLTLDAAGDPNAVFIFQTGSTLITGSSSSVNLVNGAQSCNVFWQVGSSATLGTGSVFAGSLLAQISITVNGGVTIHGRTLARTGAVTLDDDTFTDAGCAPTGPTTTIAGPGSTTTSSIPVGPTTTIAGPGPTTTTSRVGPTTTIAGPGPTTTTSPATTTSSIPARPTTTTSGTSTTSPKGSTTLPSTSTLPKTTVVPTTSNSGQTSTTVHTGLITQTQSSGPSGSTGTGMTGGTISSGGSGSSGTTGQLARTGWPTLPLLIFGGLMVTCGLVTILIGRDRRVSR